MNETVRKRTINNSGETRTGHNIVKLSSNTLQATRRANKNNIRVSHTQCSNSDGDFFLLIRSTLSSQSLFASVWRERVCLDLFNIRSLQRQHQHKHWTHKSRVWPEVHGHANQIRRKKKKSPISSGFASKLIHLFGKRVQYSFALFGASLLTRRLYTDKIGNSGCKRRTNDNEKKKK